MSRLKTLQEYVAHRVLSGVLTLRQRCTMHIEMREAAATAATCSFGGPGNSAAGGSGFPDLVEMLEVMAKEVSSKSGI